jgi:hypothetical protein
MTRKTRVTIIDGAERQFWVDSACRDLPLLADSVEKVRTRFSSNKAATSG